MNIKSAIGNLLGLLLLAVAGIAAVYGLSVIGASIAWGLSGPRFRAILFAYGIAVTAGFFGYFARKLAAGQVLPVDYDVSAGFRGGQGGL